MQKYDYIDAANKATPSENQLEFMNTEFIAFVHYGMNTFVNTEWGTGREPEKYFNPAEFSAKQWVSVIKSTGMKGLILTCKYSDGFCLWPSKYTSHSVKNSPWLDGKGDMVKEVANECHAQGIKFGVSVSLYDMHEPSFGSDKYNDFFVNQLTELCTQYGELFCVWFERDENGKQSYDLDRYAETVRKYQSKAVIGNCGGDIRWCGNHIAHGRSSEWSVVPKKLLSANSQALVEPDLGSRKKIKKEKELVFYPNVMDVSLRPGWFFHDSDNIEIKNLSDVLMAYFASIGNNGTLLLGIAPSHSGKIEKVDEEHLFILSRQLDIEFGNDFTVNCKFEASNRSDDLHSERFINSGASYYRTQDNPSKTEITVDMGEIRLINKVVLSEHIETGQQIEKFTLYRYYNKKWRKIYKGTTIGRKKICSLHPLEARRIKLVIEKTRNFATISDFKIY